MQEVGVRFFWGKNKGEHFKYWSRKCLLALAVVVLGKKKIQMNKYEPLTILGDFQKRTAGDADLKYIVVVIGLLSKGWNYTL